MIGFQHWWINVALGVEVLGLYIMLKQKKLILMKYSQMTLIWAEYILQNMLKEMIFIY